MTWNSQLYDTHFAFVPALGGELITLLAPQAGERILDLGCGTGHLTQKIAEYGAVITGIDSSAEMIDQARHNYPHLSFNVARGEDFQVDAPYDAVFSNAALHWMRDAEAVVQRMRAALKPGGRLVAEFGGKYNIRRILTALEQAYTQAGYPFESPWYFPSIGEYATLLEKYDFTVQYAAHFNRPTPLEGENGMADWLSMFASGLLNKLPQSARQQVIQSVVADTHADLYADGVWTADYVRLRIVAYVEDR